MRTLILVVTAHYIEFKLLCASHLSHLSLIKPSITIHAAIKLRMPI